MAVGLAVGSGWASAAETVTLPTADEIIGRMKAKWAEMKSFELVEKVTGDYSNPTLKMTGTIRVAAELGKKDGKSTERCALIGKWITRGPECRTFTEYMKLVYDGKYFWTEQRNSMGPRVDAGKDLAKTGEGAASAYLQHYYEWDPSTVEEFIHAEGHDMKVVGEETIGGQKMYVLEGSWNPAENNGTISKRKVWIGVDDLFIRRSVHTVDNGKDKKVVTFERSRVKVDQKIDPKVFKYKPPTDRPPKGVGIWDRTGAEGK